MVQIIDENETGFLKSILGGLAAGAGAGADIAPRLMQQQKDEKEYLKKLELDKERYNTIKNYFGEEEANLFKAAPEGGKTAIVQDLLERRRRGSSFNQSFGNELEEGGEKETQEDFDFGLTPRERVTRQEKRYAANLPLFQENGQKISSLDHENESLTRLEELSPKINFAERLNINTTTGDLRIPAAASAEAQEFVKIVNDFTVNAKDSYGARVTNFELDRFMKRLPTLANSLEGRKAILKRMKLVNSINLAKERATRNIIEEKGGVRNIDYDKAELLAEKRSKPQIEKFKLEAKRADKEINDIIKNNTEERRKKLPKDHVMVETAEGNQGYVPKNKLKKFLETEGNKVI